MPDAKIKCLIVDDEPLARELVAAHLSQWPQFKLVAACGSAIEANQIVTQQPIDLLFLDIEMPVMKGTDFYQNLSHKPQVIFTTAYREYAVDGFELEAVDYLLKPITFARFFKAIERFLKNHKGNETHAAETAKEDDHTFVRVDRKSVKITFANVRYIQGLKDYIEIHTTDHTWVVKSTLSAFFQSLPKSFIQVHRSYIVNRNHITAFTHQDIELGDVEIPIGKTHQKIVAVSLK